MPNNKDKGEPSVETTRISGAGNLDPSGAITVAVDELVAIDEVVSIDYALNSAGTNNDIVLDSVTVSDNTVEVEFADGAGGVPAADDLEELIVTASGY